jgi:hypothetical protein
MLGKARSMVTKWEVAIVCCGAVLILGLPLFVVAVLPDAGSVSAYASVVAAFGTVGAIFTTIWLAINQNRIAAKDARVRQSIAKKAIAIMADEAFSCFMKIDKALRGKIGAPVRNERLDQVAFSSLLALKGIDLLNLPDDRLIQPISTLINCLERRLIYNAGEEGLVDESLLYILATNAKDSIDVYTKD